jgi:hypothetical protein
VVSNDIRGRIRAWIDDAQYLAPVGDSITVFSSFHAPAWNVLVLTLCVLFVRDMIVVGWPRDGREAAREDVPHAERGNENKWFVGFVLGDNARHEVRRQCHHHK